MSIKIARARSAEQSVTLYTAEFRSTGQEEFPPVPFCTQPRKEIISLTTEIKDFLSHLTLLAHASRRQKRLTSYSIEQPRAEMWETWRQRPAKAGAVREKEYEKPNICQTCNTSYRLK